MFNTYSYGHVTDALPAAVAELILRSNGEGNVACLSKPITPYRSMILDRSGRETEAYGPQLVLHFLSCSSRVAEGLYYMCPPKLRTKPTL